jgi:transcriptional regulator with GAF, ATPase, and Fis domain
MQTTSCTSKSVSWCYSALADAAATSAVVDALARTKIEVCAWEPGRVSGPGLLLVRDVTPEVLDLAQDLSAGGRERLLALSLARTALPNEDVWRLLRSGATDVLSWLRHPEPAAEVAARLERWALVDRCLVAPVVQENLVGRSAAWLAALRQVVEVACCTAAPVLILGETGTGKELVARLIHTLDPRPGKRDLVVLDCATVVAELSGSEFFGHERGAFTGAVAPRDGAFALADGGTLFLDEVGELPVPLQAELLRAVQEGSYKRIGGNAWRTAAFRLLCATNRDLQAEIERHAFRRDLYYRLASVTCRLPALRERVEDVVPLARHFIAQLRPGVPPPELDEPVREYLLARDYPGNVRDLRQLVTRIMARHVGPGPITAGDIPEGERPAVNGLGRDWRDPAFEGAIRRAVAQGAGLRDIGRAAAETAVSVAVGEEGSLQRAARRLGVTDRALQMRRAARRGPAAGGESRPL